MFKHLFKLIWNKKKQNFLLMFEMLISFMVIFAVFTLVVYYYQNFKKPMGFDYENVWVINYNNSLKISNLDSLVLFYETVRQTLKSMPQVKEVSFTSDNVPFSQVTNTTGLVYNNKKINRVNNYVVEDRYRDALNVKVLEGHWFNKQDAVAKDKPIVINASLKEMLFRNSNAAGKLISNYDGSQKMKVIGVVNDIKAKGDYKESGTAIFFRADTGSFRWLNRILIKVTPNADAAFESRLYKTMANS
jgi:putative ABC transport system permease protein